MVGKGVGFGKVTMIVVVGMWGGRGEWVSAMVRDAFAGVCRGAVGTESVAGIVSAVVVVLLTVELAVLCSGGESVIARSMLSVSRMKLWGSAFAAARSAQ